MAVEVDRERAGVRGAAPALRRPPLRVISAACQPRLVYDARG